MSSLSTVVELTGLVHTQCDIVEQHHKTMDTTHDAFDAALLAHQKAESCKEHQAMVVKTRCTNVQDAQTALDIALDGLAVVKPCCTTVPDAQTALDIALDTLAVEKDQLKTLDSLANTVGTNRCTNVQDAQTALDIALDALAVVKACCTTVQDAQAALDIALDTLAVKKDQLKTLDSLANTVGDNIWGLHFAFEDVCEVYTNADSYLRFLEESLIIEMRYFRDLDLA